MGACTRRQYCRHAEKTNPMVTGHVDGIYVQRTNRI